MSMSEVGRRLRIGRTSVRRILEDETVTESPVQEPGK